MKLSYSLANQALILWFLTEQIVKHCMSFASSSHSVNKNSWVVSLENIVYRLDDSFVEKLLVRRLRSKNWWKFVDPFGFSWEVWRSYLYLLLIKNVDSAEGTYVADIGLDSQVYLEVLLKGREKSWSHVCSLWGCYFCWIHRVNGTLLVHLNNNVLKLKIINKS